MLIDETDYLEHYGILRRSGRYPWGSGEDVTQRSKSFFDHLQKLKDQGLSEVELARAFSMTTDELRQTKTIAKNAQKQAEIAEAQRLKDKGLSNVAIGTKMGKNESSVRALLAQGQKDTNDILTVTSNMLREHVDQKEYVDIGKGVERHIGVSRDKLKAAVAILRDEGYQVYYPKVKQVATGLYTSVKVLGRPDTTWTDVYNHPEKIQQISEFSDDGGRTFLGLHPPMSISSKRVAIRYAEQGGAGEDGVIYVRPGVDDISMGRSRYAQVRIAVDGTHYIKGMAIYKDDLPDGVDLVFNTNKSTTGNKLDALKKMETDTDNPFGSNIRRQIIKLDKDGKEVLTSSMNIVYEEGKWEDWSKNVASQMLSKQNPILAKTQLNMTHETRSKELDQILALTNPAVRRKLLDDFAAAADASAVHLEAAGFPRQGWHVILPVNTMKETEVYAPNYRDGERVVLIRYPHGGRFEIPELVVNNKHKDAKATLGIARDAIGIHSKVAERLSGADFDGDTVLVIPNDSNRIKTSPALEGLKNFDPKKSYPGYDGMPKLSPDRKQQLMGDVTNLVTDMTIKGAKPDEVTRAVRHSMVIIDAEKHNLNYKQSALDNGIPALKEKYQGGKRSGASTLISKSGSEIYVPKRLPQLAEKGGPISKVTGKKQFKEEPESYTTKDGTLIIRRVKSTRGAETDDASTLSSGTVIENIYATHANRMKDLANEARKASVNTQSIPYSPSARKHYAKEVEKLDADLNIALKNAPLERQAQLVAQSIISTKKAANPNLGKDELKKVEFQALTEARRRTGADKLQIHISDSQWEAIQAGAISNNKLTEILNHADMERVRQLATPKPKLLMTSTKQTRARAMLASGYTQAEVASAIGVSVSTLKLGLMEIDNG